MNNSLLIALLAAIFAPLVTYLVAARRLSGRIATSEASELWEEATNLRNEYRSEVERLRAEIASCHERISIVESRNGELRKENGRLREEIHEHKRTIERLQEKNSLLEIEVDKLKEEVNAH